MTVKVTKPSVNIREELASLKKPSGIVGESILRADTAAEAVEQLNLEDHTFTTFTSTGIDDNATSTAMTLDSSGNLLVGTTDNSVYNNGSNTSADTGINLTTTYAAFARYNGTPMYVNRTGIDGDIITFNKSGAPVGGIGTTSGDLTISSLASSHAGLRFSNANILPLKDGSLSEGGIDLGQASGGYGFKDLYLSGGVVFGTGGPSPITSNTLDDYEEGTWTPSDGSGAGLTFSTATGYYTKVGRQVFVSCSVVYPSTSDTTDASILGLPFTPDTNFFFAGSLAYTTSAIIVASQVTSSGTRIIFRKDASSTQVENNEISGKAIRLSMTYTT